MESALLYFLVFFFLVFTRWVIVGPFHLRLRNRRKSSVKKQKQKINCWWCAQSPYNFMLFLKILFP